MRKAKDGESVASSKTPVGLTSGEARPRVDAADPIGRTRGWHELLRAASARIRWLLARRFGALRADLSGLLPRADIGRAKHRVGIERPRLHAAPGSDPEQQAKLEVLALRAEVATLTEALAHARASESRARLQASHDGLTSLPNRALFLSGLDEALTRAVETRDSFVVLYLDLDRFKPVNDTHGHAAGDELLKIVAGRLAHSTRAKDVVGRLSGDEFACLLIGVSTREQAERIVGKLFQAVAAPLTIGGTELSVQPSIGIAMFPADGVLPEVLLRHADVAMYRAKRHRCRYAFFDESIDR